MTYDTLWDVPNVSAKDRFSQPSRTTVSATFYVSDGPW